MSRFAAQRRKEPTAADKRALLVRSLYERKPQMLASLNADTLAGQYGVDSKIAEYELIIARQNRAKEL